MTEITLKSTIDVEEIMQMGGDAKIAHAATVSTRGIAQGGNIATGEEKISGLINSLMRNRHGTPFEHGALTVRVHAPIKVWREWHRHRIGWSYNEESARYKQLEPVFYVPPPHRPMIRNEGFKSMRPDFGVANDDQYRILHHQLGQAYSSAYQCYERLLSQGFDRGLARDVLGVGIFSACYCTANPRSIMAFLELRTRHDDAKRPSRPLWEINEAANKLEAIFGLYWPITHAAWVANGRAAP